MSEDPKNPFEPDPDFFANPESFAGNDQPGAMPDFFDDADSFTETGPLEPMPPVVEEPHASGHYEPTDPQPFADYLDVEEPAAPMGSAVEEAAAAKAAAWSAATAAESNEYRPKVFPASIAMMFLGGALMAGGISIGKFLPSESAPAETPAAPSTPAPAASAPAVAAAAEPASAKPAEPAAPPPASAEELKSVAGSVDSIGKLVETQAEELAALRKKVDSLPKPPPRVDLTPIETSIAAIEQRLTELAAKPAPAPAPTPASASDGKVDELAKTVAALPAKLDELQKKLAKQDETIASLRARLEEKPAATAAASPSTRPGMPSLPSGSTPAVDPETEFNAAVALYRQQQWGPARDAFVKLQGTAPDDARVWYYSAVANGYATQQWAEGSDTVRYVTRGVERERAGTPDRAKIDAAFTDLTPDARNWLGAYRAVAR
ncbi:MAG: hypothetical protein SFX72_16410 [Isosphaeraceae bacterium]|nr:hypothetical protein [Isosphaeraceae bacterium]